MYPQTKSILSIKSGNEEASADEDTSNDDSSNLVLCESQEYHSLLHQRKRAYMACGNAKWRKCRICIIY